MNAVVSKKIEEFFSRYKSRNYHHGHILILHGDLPEYIFYLINGRVKQTDTTYRGDEIILNTFKPRAFFPMSLAINKGANPYTYEAETGIEVRQAPTNDVLDFLKQNPDVTLDLLSRVYIGTDQLLGRITQLMSGSAKSRLIYELLLEARRFGEIDRTGIGSSLKIREKDLGAHAGLSRETVSREVAKLKAEGLISVKRGGIHITNVSILEQKLGQDF